MFSKKNPVFSKNFKRFVFLEILKLLLPVLNINVYIVLFRKCNFYLFLTNLIYYWLKFHFVCIYALCKHIFFKFLFHFFSKFSSIFYSMAVFFPHNSVATRMDITLPPKHSFPRARPSFR